ncbi:hypothetical protein F511_08354 [Dorcoceras hygrometricum]|uniref:Ribosomal eL28/Mak16 domain-containing protein n=1 Tax=Dorcoceras hygrometricum TaxID=472368 RepID=A0A2Z7DCA9_9LAMI|nr:hypothetical protein F511_08354 [Dorcoceras hygrometricum]
MASVPGQLIWEIVKKNNCFLVKEFGNGTAGVKFSKEPNNLFNIHSYKYSGLANKKTVTIQPGKDKSVLLATAKTKKQNKPAQLLHKSVMKKEFSLMSINVIILLFSSVTLVKPSQQNRRVQFPLPKGLANKKTVTIQPGKDKSVLLATAKTKKQNKPAQLLHKSVMKKEFSRMAKVVSNQVVDNYYRPDLKKAALARLSVVDRSLKVSKSGVKKRNRQAA